MALINKKDVSEVLPKELKGNVYWEIEYCYGSFSLHLAGSGLSREITGHTKFATTREILEEIQEKAELIVYEWNVILSIKGRY